MSATASHAVYVSEAKPLDWSRAVTAGLVATVVITISMALFGMNIMKSLGSMMLPGANTTVQYIAGGVFHFAVGLFWGVLYAWLFGKVAVCGPFLKGIVYGLAITAVALAVMPLMAMIMPGGLSGAANPCNPCASKAAAGNPCNPCASKAAAGNPCASKAAANPCNPCAAKAAANPCAPKNACSTAMAANPCNPCGGTGQNPFSGAISAVNHLLFALTLAFIYRGRPAA